MKPAKTNDAMPIRKGRALILLGTLVAVLTTMGCSGNSKPAAKKSPTGDARLRPASVAVAAPAVAQPAPIAVADKTSSAMKPSPSKLIAYRSRDWGVSFLYPWQYAFISAKAIATGDGSLRPNSDGRDSQFTLARIEIPKGFYPDTDFESGYFTLSLNQDLNEQECQATLAPVENGKVETDTINGVEFRWMETDSGGHGSAAKLRNYVAFVNGTCYELELGVKTSNADGTARELDPDHVLQRLDVILRTVKILPAMKEAAAAEKETPAVTPAPKSQD